MGTTDNSSANSAAKSIQSKTPASAPPIPPTPSAPPLTGSTGFGAGNNMGNAFTGSNAFAGSDPLSPSMDAFDNTFNADAVNPPPDVDISSGSFALPGTSTPSAFKNDIGQEFMNTPAPDIALGPVPLADGELPPPRPDTPRDVKAALNRSNTAARKLAQSNNALDRQAADRDARDQRQSAKTKRAFEELHAQQQTQKAAAVERLSDAVPQSQNITETRENREGLPDIDADTFTANRRAAEYLASRDDIQDYPRWEIADIEQQGDAAVAKTADLIRQTEARSPAQAQRLYDGIVYGLDDEKRAALDRALGLNGNEGDTSTKDQVEGEPTPADEKAVLSQILNLRTNVQEHSRRAQAEEVKVRQSEAEFDDAVSARDSLRAEAAASFAGDAKSFAGAARRAATRGPIGAVISVINSAVMAHRLKLAETRVNEAKHDIEGAQMRLEFEKNTARKYQSQIDDLQK